MKNVVKEVVQMREFTLITDVNTDVHPAYAAKEGILILPQYYFFEGDDVVYRRCRSSIA